MSFLSAVNDGNNLCPECNKWKSNPNDYACRECIYESTECSCGNEKSPGYPECFDCYSGHL